MLFLKIFFCFICYSARQSIYMYKGVKWDMFTSCACKKNLNKVIYKQAVSITSKASTTPEKLLVSGNHTFKDDYKPQKTLLGYLNEPKVEGAPLKAAINVGSCGCDVLNIGKKTSTGVYFDGRYLIPAVTHNNTLPENCMELKNNGYNVSGIYRIKPKTAKKPFPVLCDMDIKGGGWTYIQNRYDGSEDFAVNYHDYKFGFGDLNGEFWLGLHNIRSLARQEEWNSLLVEIVDRDNQPAFAHYYLFAVASESNGFRLTLDGYSGNAGDSLSIHKNQRFATYDYDTNNSCATKYTGGWWFNNCLDSNLNGRHINVGTVDNNHGIYWKTYRGGDYIHAKTKMLIKPNL